MPVSRRLIGAVALLCLLAIPAVATMPVVKTVPWDPNNFGAPHDTISGRNIYVKATTDVQGLGFQFMWDFGDGTTSAWATVSNSYDIGTTHIYTGAVGQPFTAKVYVKDVATAEVASANYLVTIRPSSLQVEVNIAIDEGLWCLHQQMTSRSGSGATATGRWIGGTAGSGYPGNDAVNVNAFLVNGHKPDWNYPANLNPYTETVVRGLNFVLTTLAQTAVSNYLNSKGAVNSDGNANGVGIYVNSAYPSYQGGMVMDMLVATDTPTQTANVGGAGIVGKTFKNIVQDMVDYYAQCQQHGYGYGADGGWRYSCVYGSSDNSFNQWGVIGMLAAERNVSPTDFGAYIDPNMVGLNVDWTNYSYYNGGFGYDRPNYYPWGAFATTPSGMVQMALQRRGRGNSYWDGAEAYIRNNWVDVPGGANPYNSVLGYYYGLFSFTKSMLLHDNGTTLPGGNPLSQLCSRDASNNLINCIDWYGADRATGSPVNGVARTLVSQQQVGGYWWCHEVSGTQCYFETAWAIIMLHKTVFASGLPVAVIDASPIALANGGSVNFTGKHSFHQNYPARDIVQWEWDFNNDGVFDASGVNQNGIVFTAATFPAQRTVRLRVTDNSNPPLTADATVVITITSPPFAPTAHAGGPYNICPQAAYLPFYLNGTGSKNPDDGQTDGSPGAPGDFITQYAWDVLGNGTYTAMTAQPRVDDLYATAGKLGNGQIIQVGLRVTDNTALSFPTSGQGNLQGFATAQVYLRTPTDQFCTKCVQSAQALPKAASGTQPAIIQLLWLETGAHHYNIMRGPVNGGPYTMIGTVTNTILGTGKTLAFTDKNITVGVTYYYRIAPATLADIETCQSNQANASARVTPLR